MATFRRLASLALLLAATVTVDAHAEGTPAPPQPGVDHIRSAAAEYDAGRRAFTDGKFEEAAIHFENAFHDAPRAEALRNAIRARRDAKQFARAATLASIATSRYPDDPTTMTLARETLAESAPKLHKVTLSCKPQCGIAADGRAVTLDDASKLSFFLSPGSHDLVVSWTEERSKRLKITAREGGEEDLTLDAPPLPVAPAVLAPHEGAATPDAASAAREKPLGPVVFFLGAGLTLVGVGATIVSGVDAQNNPGTDAVRRDCAGKGESCPTYQKGRDAQFRTNVLLVASVGVGLLTGVVGVFFTQWSAPGRERNRAQIEPFLGLGAAGLRGTF